MATKPTITVMSKKSGRLNKRTVVVAVVVLVVTLGAAGVWMIHHNSVSKNHKLTGARQLTPQEVAKAVNADFAKGNYDAAINILKDQPQDTQTQLALATAYVNKKDYKPALDIYAALDREGKLTLGNLTGAASVAEVAKQYSLALQYYQKAKEQTLAQKTSIPTWQDEVAMQDAAIKRLRQKL